MAIFLLPINIFSPRLYMEISFVRWDDAHTDLRFIRRKVFIDEQQVPESLEWDEDDKIAVHLLGKEKGRPVACARLTSDGKLGRLAVLKEYRKHGWGSKLIRLAERFLHSKKINKIYLHSQANSYYFYFQHGFRPTKEMIWDANIPHVRMQKIIGRSNPNSNTFLMGLDGESYYSDQSAACAVWFQIASSQSRREIDIEIKDLSHPVFNNAACLENLTTFIRQSQRTRIRVLLHNEIPGLSEHPLMLAQQRLSSRFMVRRIQDSRFSEAPMNYLVFDYKGIIRFDYKSTYCNFDNGVSVKRQKLKFDEEWDRSKQLIEGRKLHI